VTATGLQNRAISFHVWVRGY